MSEEKGFFEQIGGFVGAVASLAISAPLAIGNTIVGVVQGRDLDEIEEECSNIFENVGKAGEEMGEKAAPLIGTVITAALGAVVTNEVNKSYKKDSDKIA